MRLRSRGSPTSSPENKNKKQKMKQKQKQAQAKKGNSGVGRKRVKQQSSQKKLDKVRPKRGKSPEKVSSPSPQSPKQKGKGKSKKERQKSVSPPKNKKEQQKQKKDKAKGSQKKKAQKKQQKQEKNKGETSQNEEKEKGKRKRQKSPQQQQQIQKVIVKGNIPIDTHFTGPKNVHVLQQGGKIYSATLNQTNVSNNNNKFYILQILQSDSNTDHCYFFTRWGRVGVTGQVSCVGPMNASLAISNYTKKYKDKYHSGDYREVQINYNEDEQKKDDVQQKKDQNKNKNKKESTLSKPVQSLINLIFDLNMMNRHMKQIGYNVKKMPLGKLSKANILKGYEILKQLSNEIQKNNRVEVVNQLTNDFYSYIPHDFGFQKMSHFVLNTIKKVKEKLELLEALGEIKIATSMISDDTDDNQIDVNYKKLNRDIISVQKGTDEFKMIDKYLQTTHGTTHSSYSLQLDDLFSINDQRENIRYTNDIGNKLLLWHGSRLTNYVGILSQGLRIAPPQAPVTGYMFGKGVYFADMSSKSANYCFTNRDNNTGILLLCQVACGNMNQKLHADYYASNLPDGKNSTKGVGRLAPPQKNYVKHGDYMIPMGPAESTDIAACYLQYNQYIVYDVAQIKIKYLLRTKFNYR